MEVAWIKLMTTILKIIVGFQYKNYFSGLTILTKKNIDDKIDKMIKIINKLSEEEKKQYKFYYLIVCPSFDFSEENHPEETQIYAIEENDYINYASEKMTPEIQKILTIVIFKESYVEKLTGNVFPKTQIEREKIMEELLNILKFYDPNP